MLCIRNWLDPGLTEALGQAGNSILCMHYVRHIPHTTAGGEGGRREQRPEGRISEAGEGFLLPVSVQQSGYFPVFCPPPDPCAPIPYKREVGGVLLHTQRLHKSIWQDACGVGSRDGLELRSATLVFLLPLVTKWQSVEGPRECWWGNMGLY